MKRFLMLVAVAAVAGAMYVAAAPGSQQATPPTARQFAALKKQVTRMKKTLTLLKRDETKVKAAAGEAAGFIAGCLVTAGVAPVSQFGDATTATYGFQYVATPATTPVNRTALDIDSSTAPQGYLQSVDPSCIGSGTTTSTRIFSSSKHLPVRAERAH